MFNQLPMDWNYTPEDLAWGGLTNRTNEGCIKLNKGLCSGERNTDFTNTILNRIQFEAVHQDVQKIFGSVLRDSEGKILKE